MHKLSRISATLVAALIGAAGCATEPSAPTAPATSLALELDPDSVTLMMDETVTLSATLVDRDGNRAAPASRRLAIEWSSSDRNVVRVRDGLLVPIGVGTATVTATADGAEPATASVDVRRYLAEELPQTHGELSFEYGDETFTISAEFGLHPTDIRSVYSNRSSWVVSFYFARRDRQDVLGVRQDPDGSGYDEVALFLEEGRVTEPTTIDYRGRDWMAGYLGLDCRPGAGFSEWYEIYDLVVTFTEVTEDRMRGTLSFSLVDWSSGEKEVVAEVTEGTLDLPVGPDWPGG